MTAEPVSDVTKGLERWWGRGVMGPKKSRDSVHCLLTKNLAKSKKSNFSRANFFSEADGFLCIISKLALSQGLYSSGSSSRSEEHIFFSVTGLLEQ